MQGCEGNEFAQLLFGILRLSQHSVSIRLRLRAQFIVRLARACFRAPGSLKLGSDLLRKHRLSRIWDTWDVSGSMRQDRPHGG